MLYLIERLAFLTAAGDGPYWQPVTRIEALSVQ